MIKLAVCYVPARKRRASDYLFTIQKDASLRDYDHFRVLLSPKTDFPSATTFFE